MDSCSRGSPERLFQHHKLYVLVYCPNKPWVTQGVKAVLNQKKAAFRTKDKEKVKAAQRDVKHCMREAKDSYRRKVEQKLRENCSSDVWDGLRTIIGHKAQTSTEGGR